MASSPVSSLSSLESDEEPDMPSHGHHDNATPDADADFDEDESTVDPPRPAKRRRISGPSGADSPPLTAVQIEEEEDLGDISSDTSGSAPPTPKPGYIALVSEDTLALECTRECRWGGCIAGDVGNQDILVEHVLDHVQNAKKDKFACQWEECRAKGKPQMSAYALRAHMRSHTKEKPFYCLLPECDKSFTRSDALAKHMRTVHENESIRISDLFAHNKKAQEKDKGGSQEAEYAQQPAPAPETTKRTMLKLTFNGKSTSSSAEPSHEGEVVIAQRSPLSPRSLDHLLGPFPEDIGLSPQEQMMKPKELFRLLRRQEIWAQQEGQELGKQITEIKTQYKSEWLSTQLLLQNLMEAEHTKSDFADLFDGDADPLFKQLIEESRADEENGEASEPFWQQRIREIVSQLKEEAVTAAELPIRDGDSLWYRSSDTQPRQRNGIKKAVDGMDTSSSHASIGGDSDTGAMDSS